MQLFANSKGIFNVQHIQLCYSYIYIIWQILKNPSTFCRWFDSSINKFIIQSDDMLSLITVGFWLQHQYSSGHFLFEFNNKFYWILNDIWAWLNLSSLTSGFCLQLIWEFIHKHSSGWYDEKYPKAMFGVSECHSKCTVHRWIIGIGIIQ